MGKQSSLGRRKPNFSRRLKLERLLDRVLLVADFDQSLFDLSGDNQTTALDALLVINAIADQTAAHAYPAADLNADNLINAADADLAMTLTPA